MPLDVDVYQEVVSFIRVLKAETRISAPRSVKQVVFPKRRSDYQGYMDK